MTIQRVEMRETLFDVVPQRQQNEMPLIMQPEFHYGLEALKEHMFNHKTSYTAFAALELTDAALSLPKILQDTPARGKGRRIA
jgi:hypothetical protein